MYTSWDEEHAITSEFDHVWALKMVNDQAAKGRR